MRLDRFLIKTTDKPRRLVKRLISTGHVTVNGKVVKSPSHHIDPHSDVVELDGKALVYVESVNIALYKPVGYVTSTSDPDHPAVLDLITGLPFHGKVFPAGRLDLDAEGLVFLTSDGQLAHRITHPRYHIPRVYEVEIERPLAEDRLEAIRRGEVVLSDGYRPLPAEVELMEETKLKLTVYEGKYHLVKRLIAASGSKVLSLKRISIGPLRLDGLAPGEWRMLSDDELKALEECIERAKRTVRR